MNLQHIAISVSELSEIKDFYKNILGMEVTKKFKLSPDLANTIFNICKEVTVFQLKKGNVELEVFVCSEKTNLGFAHICVSVSHREELLQNANEQGYRTIIITRDYGDLMFLSDKSGNLFEIKEV